MQIETEPQEKQNLQSKKTEMEFRDLTKSYLFFRNKIPDTSMQDFKIKRKCIEIGKELLPNIGDITDEEERDYIKELYDEAIIILKSVKIDKRSISFNFQDFGKDRIPVYKIKADDGGSCHAEKEELNLVLESFIQMQFEDHISSLQQVDDEIFHILVKYEIIKKSNPSFNDMIDEMIKKDFPKGEC